MVAFVQNVYYNHYVCRRISFPILEICLEKVFIKRTGVKKWQRS